MPNNSWVDVVCLFTEQYDAKSNLKLGGFDPSFKRPTCLATLKCCNKTKQSVCGWQYIFIYIYIYIYGSILNTMVMFIKNGIDNPNSNPGRGCLKFILCQYPWETCICSPSYELIVRQTDFFSLGKGNQSTKRKKSKFKLTVALCLKRPYCFLPAVEELDIYIYIYIHTYVYIYSKLTNRSEGWPEDSLFNSFCTKV